MKFHTIVAGAGAALALLGASAAGATTYMLAYSDAFGTGNFGTVDVTGTSTDLHFVVSLNSPYKIIDTGSHHAVAMNLAGSGFVLTGLNSSDFTLYTSAAAFKSSPFDGFNVGLNCLACGSGASSPWGPSLTFDITGTGLSVKPADPFNGHVIDFAVDVVGAGGNTGTVGGGPGPGGVPEPTSWALMILGFGGVGGMLRSVRRRALVTA
jgi:hypothetical protein